MNTMPCRITDLPEPELIDDRSEDKAFAEFVWDLTSGKRSNAATDYFGAFLVDWIADNPDVVAEAAITGLTDYCEAGNKLVGGVTLKALGAFRDHYYGMREVMAVYGRT